MNVRKKSTLAAALSALLVLGAAGGGVAYTAVTVSAADRTAPTKVWDAPEKAPSVDDPAPDTSTGRQDNPLSKELLPVPTDYRLGPAVEGFSSDAYLTGKEAEALFGRGANGLPSQQREQHRKFVERLQIEGIAMRSYTRYSDNLVIEIKLAQMDNRSAVKDLSAFQSELADAFSLFRQGPEIEGYEKAKCFLMPENEESGIEEMSCTAYEDDVLVSLNATAYEKEWETADLKKNGAKLLKKQLDRLTKGGGISA